jgi:hypothetical protein
VIPNRWLSESRHVGQRFADCRQEGEEISPSASGSEDVLRVARPIRPQAGQRWARSTEADGEGDVREARDTKSAPAALDKAPLIDACLTLLPTLLPPLRVYRRCAPECPHPATPCPVDQFSEESSAASSRLEWSVCLHPGRGEAIIASCDSDHRHP